MVHGLGTLAAADRAAVSSGQGYTYNENKQGQGNRLGIDPAQKAVKALWRGLAAGVTGILDEPRYGMERAGTLGAVGGVLSGVLKLITEPVGGALDAMSISMSGIQTSMKGKPVGRRKAPQQILDISHLSTAVGADFVKYAHAHDEEGTSALEGSIILGLDSDSDNEEDEDDDDDITSSYSDKH